jgi:hypothetical protein
LVENNRSGRKRKREREVIIRGRINRILNQIESIIIKSKKTEKYTKNILRSIHFSLTTA